MFLRIDDRLVHGQVVTAWIKQLNAKSILVIDDLAAGNTIISKALTMATPKNIKLVIKSVEEAKSCLCDFEEKELLIITKAPVNAKKVIEENMNYEWKMNVGNMGMDKGRKKYAQTVYLDEENYAAIKELQVNDNVEIFMQTVPGQSVTKF
jgi:mannose/fructose/N-acetylgalactosamine-specific phosphotransferase system component IIB